MTELALPLALALGFVSGFKHAFEPDHVVAISTLLHRENRLSRVFSLGLTWGVGHTTTLVLSVGIVSFSHWSFSEKWLPYFEIPVAAMLLLLGALALYQTLQRLRTLRVHTHDGIPHLHVGHHPHPHTFLPARQGLQGYLIGLIHGLAGSGALLILVATTLPSTIMRILYALIFGAGSIIGMGVVTSLLSSPLLAFKKRPLFYNTLTGLSGALSIILGLHILSAFI